MKHLYEYLQFNELSDEAKKNAIDHVRDEKYGGKFGGDDEQYWAIEDDALFEPSEKEMEELFGDDYYHANGDRFMIINTRKNISYVSKDDPNYYIHCQDALAVTNDNFFYRWLGIPIRHSKDLYYTFQDGGRNSNTTIDFEIDGDEHEIFGPDGVPEWFDEMLEKAKEKFDRHMDNVLTRITEDINSQYEDESIIDTIESHEILFDEEGNPID